MMIDGIVCSNQGTCELLTLSVRLGIFHKLQDLQVIFDSNLHIELGCRIVELIVYQWNIHVQHEIIQVKTTLKRKSHIKLYTESRFWVLLQYIFVKY